MKKVVVKNLSNVETHSGEFATQELANAWIASQIEKGERCAWGRPAWTEIRQVVENGVPVFETTYEPILDANGNPVLDSQGNATYRAVRTAVIETIEHEDQFTTEIIDVSQEYVLKNARSQIAANRRFGTSLVDDFAIENVSLGINAEQSDGVLTVLGGVLTALSSGYLETAIRMVKAVNPAVFDGTFLSESRLLSYVNRIETYLGIELSTEL